MDRNQKEALAMRVSVVTILGNLALTIFKLAAGVLAHSGAMISDAIHSGSDVMSTFVVIAGVRLSGQESDQEHPFGHERFECVAAILLSVMLAATGAGIGWAGIQKIFGDAGELVVPGQLALIAAVVSILSKEGMYWYTRAAAKKIESSALMADAWHHRSDALSSIGSFAGVRPHQDAVHPPWKVWRSLRRLNKCISPPGRCARRPVAAAGTVPPLPCRQIHRHNPRR